MRRHDLDWLSLIAGLVITALGIAYWVGAVSDIRIDGRWAMPVALVGLGLAGIAGAATTMRRSAIPEAPARPDDAEIE